MKKILFGLLTLSLSASIFAAENTATMQVQAQLEVIPATADLVIENLTDAGGWNVVTNAIVYDHGQIVQGSTVIPTPEINENFRVRRADSTPTTPAYLPAGDLNIAFDSVTTAGISKGTLNSGSSTIDHQFETIPTDVTLDGTTENVQFHVKSKVLALKGTENVGVHTRVQTVTVAIN